MLNAMTRFARPRLLLATVLSAAFVAACSNDSIVEPRMHPTVPASRTALPGADSVLILGNSVAGGTSSREAFVADSLGFKVTVATDAQWGAMTPTQFASYRAIILGDPNCRTGTTSVAAASANAGVWGPVVNGNVIIIGSDPTLHRKGDVSAHGIAFATATAGKTGAYITASCYYVFNSTATPVTFLSGLSTLGGFTARDAPGCFNDAYKTADSPALTGLTSAYLSNWSCSVHEVFDSWPSDFEVLAIGRNLGGAYTAPDGTVGTPYILARGQLTIISAISLTPATTNVTTGQYATVTAHVDEGGPVANADVTFVIVDGPDAGATQTWKTDANGNANLSMVRQTEATDGIRAHFTDSRGVTQTSGRVAITWTKPADVTPPVITHTITGGTLSASGWYSSDVTVTFTATDPETAVTTSGCDTQHVTATTSVDGVTFTCTATSVGGAATDAVTIKLDKTVPTVTGAVSSGTLGANGWYTSDVVVTWTPSAAGPSGQTPSADCGNVTLTTDTPSHTFTCTITTGAGISSAQGTVTVKRDAQTPKISYALTGTLGNNGWYVSDVGVNWTTTAGPSGVNTCSSAPVAVDGTNITFTCTATAGNGKSATVTTAVAKRDATKPIVTYAGNAGSYTVDQTVAISCTPTDNLSGIATSTCAPIGGAAYTFAIGNNAFSATAQDNAGNVGGASTAFTVSVTQDAMCKLVDRWVSNGGVANSLCVKLQHADYGAFRNELSAQSGKKISTDNAAILSRLVNVLDPQ